MKMRVSQRRLGAQRGFTLLEILVATAIMGIAVAGVMSGLATAARNAARVTEYDRATMLAQIKMDELLVDELSPRNRPLVGLFTKQESGGADAGWQATISTLETRGTGLAPGQQFVERVALEIWWMDGVTRRSFVLEGFRRATAAVAAP